MRNIKISTRLTIAFGITFLLALAIAAIGFYTNSVSLAESKNIQERNEINSNILLWVRNTEANGERSIAAYNTEDPEVFANYQQRIAETSAKINKQQDYVGEHIVNPEAKALFQKVIEARTAYTSSRAMALKDIENGNTSKATDYFKNKMPGLIAQYTASIDNLYNFQKKYEADLFRQNQENSQLAITLIIGITIIVLLLSLFLSIAISRSIVKPLQNAIYHARKIAKRDLSSNISIRGKDEITQLESAYVDMTKGLSEAVNEIQQGSNSIASAAAQISAGNLDLSSRTEQQASSLAQTAATMEEITATVRQNADNTKQANSLASAATDTANNGGKTVNALVKTMAEINTKSQQVADIIGVIDSIAFQTNILALNAAVEAARAGEQGRGFAVVASEVRALAQRSAASAKEIKTLIDASVEATGKGNQQAAEAGSNMQEIVESINRVTDIMGEINAANQEQTTGIEEINAAVTQMDDVTRQNASLVEESAAAANSLEDQAAALANLVATFQLLDIPQTIDITAYNQQQQKPAANAVSKQQAAKALAHNSKPAKQKQAALRSPNRSLPKTAENDEWTEF